MHLLSYTVLILMLLTRIIYQVDSWYKLKLIKQAIAAPIIDESRVIEYINSSRV